MYSFCAALYCFVEPRNICNHFVEATGDPNKEYRIFILINTFILNDNLSLINLTNQNQNLSMYLPRFKVLYLWLENTTLKRPKRRTPTITINYMF